MIHSTALSRFKQLVALLLALTLIAVTNTSHAQTDEDLEEIDTEEFVEMEWDQSVGWLRLDDSLREGPAPFAWVTEDDAGPSLRGVLDKLNVVATQDHYIGLVIALDRPSLSITQISAIGNAIKTIRESGKTVICFSEQYDTRTYWLASYADLVVLQDKGDISLNGLGIEEMYLAGMLDKIGAKADLMQIGQYKGASESLARDTPSDAWSENIDALLSNLYQSIVSEIATNRSMTIEELEAAMAKSWQLNDVGYMRAGLIDRIAKRDLIEVTEVQFGDGFVWDDAMGESMATTRVNNPMALFGMLFSEQDTSPTQPSIAVIHAAGPITSGESSADGGPFGDESIGSRTMLEAIGFVRDEEQIKAAVIRLDSPGGSALASEVIWQAVRELGNTKPVFVSIGGMAASGGYYIASAGDEIYVEPQSILGSIGVVSGKIVLGGTYEKLGINVTRREVGPLAGMFNSVEPFNDDERQAVEVGMQQIYDQFLERVEIGRGNRLPNLDHVDEGMLFIGSQAIDNGMADEMGGLNRAIQAAAERAGLEEGNYGIVDLPRPISFQEFLSELFGDSASAPMTTQLGINVDQTWLTAAKALLGDQGWTQVSRTLDGLMLLRNEPVLMLMPSALLVR